MRMDVAIAVKKEVYEDPTFQENIKILLCKVFGYPTDLEEAKDHALERASFGLRPDCVIGGDWYVLSDASRNLLGDSIADAQAKLQIVKDGITHPDTKVADDLCDRPDFWYKKWGIYKEPVVGP